MKRHLIINALLLFVFVSCAQNNEDPIEHTIVIETSLGDMEVLLYNDTPLHRDNILKLTEEGFYDGHLFHRVINNFMIQGGDPHSVNAPQGLRLGTGGPGYTIPEEIMDNHFHKKGVLAAARKGDNVNPDKESSGSQFYIVQGQIFSEEQLAMLQNSGNRRPFSKEQIEAYTTIGGTPHLDGGYTIFGEVIKGIEVLDSIASVATDNYDRPLEDVVFSIRLK
jgi:peptidyl-prolyl cis-trans isomerase B (cyclophilin B)